MKKTELKEIWKKEEDAAHIHGWDFSHIDGRADLNLDLPWDYRQIIKQYLHDDMKILDYDTGGGEFLLSLEHPFDKTAATEGYPPNAELCRETLLPLGIDFRECNDPASIPFEDESFDMILNRHGSFYAEELYRLLKKGGIFITEQVGGDNDMDLVEMVDIATPHIAGYSYQGKQMGTAMAVRAVAHHFGIEALYDFFPEDEPDHEPVLLDLHGKNHGQIAAVFQYNYPIFTDDFRFRMEPGKFEKLRSEYQYRREVYVE